MHLPAQASLSKRCVGCDVLTKVTSLARDRAGTRSGLGRSGGFGVCWVSSALRGDWSSAAVDCEETHLCC